MYDNFWKNYLIIWRQKLVNRLMNWQVKPDFNCKYITHSMNLIINENIYPENFNLCEITALIKDPLKSSANINNIRPISVSSYLTNIFEKLILIEIQKRHKGNRKQFGFILIWIPKFRNSEIRRTQAHFFFPPVWY